ncbi:hypothetical protein [Cereibacter changlensis]|uniref:hypothetical protein n=1 Tax=Cereibacter changlensis TaxID=402884 RepID=UPI0040349919
MTTSYTEDGAAPVREITRSDNLPPDITSLPSLPPEPTAEAVIAAVAALAPTEEPKPYDVSAFTAFNLKVLAFAEACGKWRDLGTITTQLQAEKLSDFVSGARGVYAAVEARRKLEKKAHDDKAAVVQKDFVGLLTVLQKAAEGPSEMQNDWLTRENARLEKERVEAARIAKEKREEAEAQLARAALSNDVVGEAAAEALLKEAAKETKVAAKPVRAKAGSATGAGRAMSQREVRAAEIHNHNLVYMHFRDDPRVKALLQQLADAAFAAKGGSQITIKGANMITRKVAV